MSIQIKHPAIRYHGGKFRLASWIISHFPEHRCYVEPFGGGASVLLKKEASEAEVYNDLDGDVVNLFRVLRNPETAQQLVDACALTPYSRDEFNCAYEDSENRVEQARRLIVRATMGFGSAGATKGKTGFRLDTKRNDDGEPTDDERIMAIEGIHNCERCSDEGWAVGEMGITRCACGQAGTLINEGTIQAGNSPVIGIDLATGADKTVEVRYVAPPGYVMVPKEPTETMINAWLSEVANWRGHVAGYKAMLAAAPQEVK
ncbi:DNA adenine methylase [Klebsiella michiganensis]|uniref:DNA adenine methylase n=1 Tax=Klebsiella michiganensis TaxID=1134687 RepID=UPI0022AA3556|nr:DNA adenine methylase [Klebsiella michiganensis]WAT38045.1 DNA adenine methylase [Klebsiella michiganensis]